MAVASLLGGFGRKLLLGLALVAVVAAGVWVWLLRTPLAQVAGVAPPPAAPAPPPPPPPPPPWTATQLADLRTAIARADREGLRSADYDDDAIAEGRSGADTDAAATKAAEALARDFAAGRIRNRHRFNWYVDYAGPDAAARAADILTARKEGQLGSYLAGLLPDSRSYRALRDALADTPDGDPDRRDRIRANMERWRWLPRDFGTGDRLYVNLPTYRLEVKHDGETVASYRAVIGATDMPTPVLRVPVRQVIVNPDWVLPPSIVRKMHLRPGVSSRYVFSTRPDGTLRVRQKPGAGNALGKVKIEFPNALAIYFHDTPSRSLFGASTRAFSHGCVRVQDIEDLGRSLVSSPDRYADAVAGAKTRSFPVQGWRAEIVYLTMVPADGGVAFVGDPYGMDASLAAALDGRKNVRPKVIEDVGKVIAPLNAATQPTIAPEARLPMPKIDVPTLPLDIPNV